MAAESCRVSVLVQVGDKETDTSRCVKSLNNQILDDMEVLFLVQEKSELLEDYAKKDMRMRVIKTEVADYGRVMNAAIKFSRGEYIGVVEAKDFIDPEMYIELFALAKKHDADVVRSNYFEHQDEEDRLHESFLAEDADKEINTAEDTSIFYQPPIVGCGLYKREFLTEKKLLFIEDFPAENQNAGFNFKALAACEKLVVSNKAYLHHVVDEDSAVVKKKNMFLINDEYAEVEKFLKAHDGWDTYGRIFEAVKFASYFYEMLRLEPEGVEPFVLRTRAEFHDADENEMLKKEYFPKEHWKALTSILRYPPRMFLSSLRKMRKRKE